MCGAFGDSAIADIVIARYAMVMIYVAPVDAVQAAILKFLFETDVSVANALAFQIVAADFSAAMEEGLKLLMIFVIKKRLCLPTHAILLFQTSPTSEQGSAQPVCGLSLVCGFRFARVKKTNRNFWFGL